LNDLQKYLKGGDLRSISNVNQLISLIKNQQDFDDLFSQMYSDDRLIIMRAADAIEKVTINTPSFLTKHKSELLHFLDKAHDKEFKWHLVLLTSRLKLTNDEFTLVWSRLKEWVLDKNESKIVRVNSLQTLYDLTQNNKEFKNEILLLIQKLEKENIPSLNARIKKLKLQMILSVCEQIICIMEDYYDSELSKNCFKKSI